MTYKEIVANLRGVFPPVVTPFNRRDQVDEGRFRANLERYAESGVAGVVVAGSTGEAPYLTERERLKLVEAARRIIRPPQLVIVGTGLESTRETIRLSRESIVRGADALLVLPPNYYKPRMDSTALLGHYRAVADAVRRPVVIYSIPQFTGIHIDPETIGKLSHYPNIAGIKESSGNLELLQAVLRQVRGGFSVLIGSAAIFLEGLSAGAAGAVLGQANFVPELCVGVYEAFRLRQLETARELQKRLVPLADKISVPYGVQGIKAALDLCGYAGGAPRPPLMPLSLAERRAVAAAVQEARSRLEV